MRYESTCGGEQAAAFERALLSGFTPLGGVFVPSSVPKIIDTPFLVRHKDLTFADIAYSIADVFISPEEVPRADLRAIVHRALDPSRFPHPDLLPTVRLGDRLFASEQYHSPSMVFKDYSMQVLAGLLNFFMAKRGFGGTRRANAIICTTGDTGSSAIEALRHLDCVNAIVGFPRGLITDFQRRQMTTVASDNISCFQVEGSCDDIDMAILKLFADPAAVEKYSLLSVNSTNWVRIMGQISLFVYTYIKTCAIAGLELGTDIVVSVPTGACGNLASGLFAREMGLPVRLLAGNNSNGFFTRLFETGVAQVLSPPAKTLSSAMDSQFSPSLARILWLASRYEPENFGPAATAAINSGQPFILTPKALARLKEMVIGSYMINDEETRQTIKRMYDQYSRVVCPHAAVGYAALDHARIQGLVSLETPAVVVETAHQDKFAEVIRDTGVPYHAKKQFTQPERFQQWTRDEDWREKLLQLLKLHNP